MQKVALVTGGGSGIGQAIALHLAQNGLKVVIVGRRELPLKQTAEQHQNIDYQVGDICQKSNLTQLFQYIEQKYQRLDILVNNAGIAPNAGLEQMDMAIADQIWQLNIRALIETTQFALPLLKNTQGNVVNISSGLAQNPMPYASVYSASKAMVESLTVAWAKEFAPNIRFNVVAAGATDTPLYDKVGYSGDELEQYKQTVTQHIPLGRFAQPEEIANVVAFVSSEQANYATGARFAIDGGFGI